MRAALTLVERELTRFFRQPNRIAGAIGQPLIFWALFGAAFRSSFRPPAGAGAGSYAQFFLPGIAVLIVLFTSIFAMISIIEDRREGFLQGVLVSPTPRWKMVLGKVLGSTVLAVLQATLFLMVAPLAGVAVTPRVVLGAVGVLGLIAFALSALGFCIAWRMDSTQGFHAIMSVFLMPMWLLSGSFFPAEGLDSWLAWLVRLNPLSYGVAALRETLGMGGSGPSLGFSLAVTAGFALVLFALAQRMARRPAAGDLR